MAVNTPLGIMALPAKCEFDHLANSAANIALFNFNWECVTFVLYNAALICGIPTFIDTYGKSIILGRRILYPGYTPQIVLFGIDIEDIRSMLMLMKKYHMNNTGKYIVVCESRQVKLCNESYAVNLLWEFKITNVIFLKILTSGVVVGFTYFFDKSCTSSPPVQVYEWDFRMKHNKNLTKNMFPLKFQNLHGCPLIVSTFIQKPYMRIQDNIPSGADGDFLQIIVRAINASLILMTPKQGTGWGYLNSNGTWIGSLGDIYYDLANFSMTSGAITYLRHQYFQISKHYYSMTIVWVTHPLEVEAASMKLLRPLGMKTGIVFMASLLIIFILVLSLQHSRFSHLRIRLHLGQLPKGMLFRCWEICMGQPILKMPKQMVLLYFLQCWIWYCFLIRTLYQVYLIDCLKNDVYKNNLQSIEDAILAGYNFGSGPPLRDYFLDQPEVYNAWTNVESNDIHKTMLDMSGGKKFVLAMNIATEQIFIKETKKKLFVLPRKVVSSHSVLFFKKYSPLAHALNKILTQLFECGWPQKIYKNNTLSNKVIPSNDTKIIKLQHFTGCYIIIISGWIVSLTSFIVELCINKRKI